jgi:hypothetical protein
MLGAGVERDVLFLCYREVAMDWSSINLRRRSVFVLFIYLLLVAAVALVLFWRFPNNVTAPNFYGEDGSVYLQSILNHGWLRGAFETFNGYFIIGLYLLCGLGWLINALFLGGAFLTLPVGFALSAIAFMAAVIALPYLLFRRAFGWLPTTLVVVFGALMPLPQSPHIVIGTIGNDKWIFLYLAFLLVLYRVTNHRRLHWPTLLAIDAGILISAYTNSTVYFLAPLAFWPYAVEFWQRRHIIKPLDYLRRVWRDQEFISMAGLYVLLLPQIVYIATHGIPKLAGYLDTPFRMSRAIELFVNRTYLFGVTHLINGHVDDVGAVMLFGLLLFLAWKELKGSARLAFWFGVYAAGMASLLFTINRPGVTDFFLGYKPGGSGPDQFFYAQTLVMYLPIALVAFGAAGSFRRNRPLRASLLIVFVAAIVVSGFVSIIYRGDQWHNASVFENDAGTFIDQAITACTSSGGSIVRVTVYPYADGRFALNAPRAKVCGGALRPYQLSAEDLGLRVNNNDYSPITRSKQFTQTFVAGSDNLDGIRLFISTFGVPFRRGAYELELLDSSCSKTLRTRDISTKLMDNAYYNVRFEPLANSAQRTYCFTLDAPSSNFDPIAIQRSRPDAYTAGTYTDSGRLQTTDVVFEPLFTQLH